MWEVLAAGPECWAAQVLTGSQVYSAGVIEYKGELLKEMFLKEIRRRRLRLSLKLIAAAWRRSSE